MIKIPYQGKEMGRKSRTKHSDLGDIPPPPFMLSDKMYNIHTFDAIVDIKGNVYRRTEKNTYQRNWMQPIIS